MASCFADELPHSDSELENSEQEENSIESIQREIQICGSLHSYDMNIHTASYNAEAQLFSGLHEGLFSYDPVTLAPVPALCESYKISRNKKRWTFYLRDNIKFSNGEKITAQIIKDSWIKLLSTENAPFASLFDSVTGAKDLRTKKGPAENLGVQVRDEKTIVVHLDEPTGHLPKILCHHAFSALSTEKNVYSGAFVLESFENGEIVLKKNENYWDAQTVKVPGIRLHLTDDYAENSFKFNNGQFDWVMGNAEFDSIINKNSVQVSAEFGTVYLFFKLKNDPWDKVEFRNALLEAINYDKLRENSGVKAETLIYPLVGYPKVTGINDYDSQDALEMMNSARKKYNIPLDKKLKIIFALTTDDYYKKWVDVLKEAWEPLGVEIEIQNTTAERYNASIASWNADLFFYSWIGDFADPLAFLELFRGESSLNLSNYKNEEYDSLLVQASRLDDINEQYKCMSKAEQILLDESMIIPVSHPLAAHLINLNDIGGWKTNALDLHPLKYMFVRPSTKMNLPNLVMLRKNYL